MFQVPTRTSGVSLMRQVCVIRNRQIGDSDVCVCVCWRVNSTRRFSSVLIRMIAAIVTAVGSIGGQMVLLFLYFSVHCDAYNQKGKLQWLYLTPGPGLFK